MEHLGIVSQPRSSKYLCSVSWKLYDCIDQKITLMNLISINKKIILFVLY
jgi:hypothetical protein